ncbi:MAG TPA: MlaD family protein [Thermoleophilaceae bacterium]|nr:MlaD family protein [Thermoleophilaceae bacterium]
MARLPFSDILSQRPGHRHALSPFWAGLIAIIVIAIGSYFAYTKANPFDDPYELNFVVRSANEMKQRSPVRVAGVDVGEVIKVEPITIDERRELLPEQADESFARVKMVIEDEEALPIKEDATIKIRNRIFLEGNYFVELHPGSPSAPEIESGSTLPAEQADFPTQQHQVLQDVLRRDQREDFRIIFDELSTALEGAGAAGFNEAIRYWERAYRDSAQVSEAYLGTEEHDLSRLLRSQGQVFRALSANEEALKGFVTNLNRTMGAFAVQEDNLKATIPQLRDVLRVGRPALQSLNSALPSLRAFAREALPGTRAASPTLDAQIPLVQQLRQLVSEDELQGLVADLRDAIPDIVELNKGSRRTFRFTRALSACQNNVLVPFATEPIPHPDFASANPEDDNSGESWVEQQQRAFVGLAGESRLFDANSSFFRVQAGGGPVQLVTTGEAGQEYFSRQLFPIEGVRPVGPPTGYRPKFRPDQPCELQEVPNLHAARSRAAETEITPQSVVATAEAKAREAKAQYEWNKVVDHMRRQAKGLKTFDPLVHTTAATEQRELRRLGLVRLKNGRLADAPRRAEASFGEGAE